MQQDHYQTLEQEYQRFIEFGKLLDRKTRKYLVEYLHNKLEPDTYALPELNDQYFRYFKSSLDELFEIRDLLNLCRQNRKITRRIVLDTLHWLRKTYQKVQAKNPFEEELSRIDNWAVTPLHVFTGRWHLLIQYLMKVYSRDQLDTQFYQDRFQTLVGKKRLEEIPAEDKEKIELLLTDLLAQWDARLQAKILEYQLTKFEEEREAYFELLEAKVREYQQIKSLLSPFTDYLGWDMSRSLWQETSFDILQHYHDLLENEASLKELADLLGNMREAEIEIEEETYEKTIIRQEWQADPHSKSEIVGIHESDDLSNLLSSEVSMLSDPETEMLFLKRLADKNLLTFRHEDRRLVRSEDQTTEVFNRVRQKEKGPFIVCVDTSESMTGRPEQIAKVLCFGILKMAMRENRRAYLINFSIGIKTLDLHDIANSIDEIAKFLRMSFYGGTDITLALGEAIRQLRTNDYAEADVLVISDFIMYKVSPDTLQEISYFQQNKDTQFHSLTLSTEPNADILNRFDTNWLYDPKEKGIIRELTRGLQTIGNRKI